MSVDGNHTKPTERRTRRGVRALAAVALGWLVLAGLTPPGAARADERQVIAGLEADLVEVAKAHSAANRELTELRRKITDEQTKVADAGRRRDDANSKVQDWARVAYKSGGTVYFAYLVGDLSSASTRNDYIQRIAQKSRRSGDEARAAGEDADAHLRTLRDLEAKAARDLADAEALQKSLEQKQAEQQKRLQERLAAEKAAASAASTSVTAAPAGGAPASSSSTTSQPAGAGAAAGAAGAGAPAGGKDGGVFEVTCYAENGPTASGKHTGPGVAATDPRVIPLGTSFLVEGYGVFTAWDTGGAIKGNRIDIWNGSESWCNDFGRRKLHVTIF